MVKQVHIPRKKSWSEKKMIAFMIAFLGLFLIMLSIYNAAIVAPKKASLWYVIISVCIMLLFIIVLALVSTHLENGNVNKDVLNLGAFLGLLLGALVFILFR